MLFHKFYSPEDSNTSAPGNIPSAGDKSDDIKFLGGDDEPEILDITPSKKEIPSKSKAKVESDDEEADVNDSEVESEEDELEELVSDLDEEEPSEEQLDVVTPIRRKEILKKYPTLFKDFPYLEKAYYREQQFTELLPTIADAKQAVAKSETLDRFESDLMGGKTETILKAVRDSDQNSFNKIVDDYLPSLARVDEKAYLHVLGNVSKHTIMSMINEGKRSGNEALQAAATVLHQFVFGSSEWKPPSNLSKGEVANIDPRIKEFEDSKSQFVKERFESSRTELNSKLNNSLESTIEANIDPKSSMTDYVKKTAIRDANEQLGKLILQDSRFKGIVDRLWENAFKNNFSKDSTDKIKSAYLSKAKTLLPSVIKKARIDALKGMGKRVNETNDSDEESPSVKSKPRSNSGRESSPTTKKGEVPRGMRSIDFLMQD